MTLGTLGWLRIVSALEQVKGERWTGFANRHGDWGRDAALWFGRRAGGLPLGELGRLVAVVGMENAGSEPLRRESLREGVNLVIL
jgi:hypothetical protein